MLYFVQDVERENKSSIFTNFLVPLIFEKLSPHLEAITYSPYDFLPEQIQNVCVMFVCSKFAELHLTLC